MSSVNVAATQFRQVNIASDPLRTDSAPPIPASGMRTMIPAAQREGNDVRARLASMPSPTPLNPRLAAQLRQDADFLPALLPKVGPNAFAGAQAAILLNRLSNREIDASAALDQLRELRCGLAADEPSFASCLKSLDAIERVVLDHPLREMEALAEPRDAAAIRGFADAIGEWREKLLMADTPGDARQVAALFRNQAETIGEATRDVPGAAAERLRLDAAAVFEHLADLAEQKAAYCELREKAAALNAANLASAAVFKEEFQPEEVRSAVTNALDAAAKVGIDVSADRNALTKAGGNMTRSVARDILAGLRERLGAAGLNRTGL